MFIEVTNGKDGFRPQGDDLRRQVQVDIYVCPPGHTKFVGWYPAFRNKLKGLGDHQLISLTKATTRFVNANVGQWAVQRLEVAKGTLVLVEYLKWSSDPTSWDRETTYLLLECEETGPLYNIALDLPPHFLADVNTVYFKGRFNIITGSDGLKSNAHREAVEAHFSHDCEEELAATIGMEQAEDAFEITVLEKRITPAVKVSKPARTGRKISQFRRIRRIKT